MAHICSMDRVKSSERDAPCVAGWWEKLSSLLRLAGGGGEPLTDLHEFGEPDMQRDLGGILQREKDEYQGLSTMIAESEGTGRQ